MMPRIPRLATTNYGTETNPSSGITSPKPTSFFLFSLSEVIFYNSIWRRREYFDGEVCVSHPLFRLAEESSLSEVDEQQRC